MKSTLRMSAKNGSELMDASKEEQLRDAISLIWRNLPKGPTTFGACSRKCGRGAGGRGGGPCIHCAEDDLAELVGGAHGKHYGYSHAAGYVKAVQEVRRIERAMLARVEDDQS